MLWLYLHFPSLQLNTLYTDHEGQDAPLVIVDGQKNEVVQLNASAQTAGIKVAMGLGTAASLCHNLQVKPYDVHCEQNALKHIAHWLYPVTADIALFPPNGLLLRVSPMLTFYQGLDEYWQVLSQRLKTLTVQYHYATGYSPFAARILANQTLNTLSDNKAWLLDQVKQQSLTCSDLTTKDIKHFHKVGVRTFADLLQLPLPELSKRFNIDIVNYIGRVTGQLQHQVNFYIPPSQFEHYLELHYEVSVLQRLEKPALKLLTLLADYLKHKDQFATEIQWLLHQRDNDALVVQVAAAQGESKTEKWWQLTQLTLESKKLIAPVIAITLKSKQLINKHAQKNDLFQGSKGCQSPDELVATLIAKLGEDKVSGVQVLADDRPEIANQLCPPLAFDITTIPTEKLRPSVLLPTPRPLSEQVNILSNPERIVSGWWDSQPVMRDYFIARDKQGRWLWLFRDQQQNWFVHGLFS